MTPLPARSIAISRPSWRRLSPFPFIAMLDVTLVCLRRPQPGLFTSHHDHPTFNFDGFRKPGASRKNAAGESASNLHCGSRIVVYVWDDDSQKLAHNVVANDAVVGDAAGNRSFRGVCSSQGAAHSRFNVTSWSLWRSSSVWTVMDTTSHAACGEGDG